MKLGEEVFENPPLFFCPTGGLLLGTVCSFMHTTSRGNPAVMCPQSCSYGLPKLAARQIAPQAPSKADGTCIACFVKCRRNHPLLPFVFCAPTRSNAIPHSGGGRSLWHPTPDVKNAGLSCGIIFPRASRVNDWLAFLQAHLKQILPVLKCATSKSRLSKGLFLAVIKRRRLVPGVTPSP